MLPDKMIFHITNEERRSDRTPFPLLVMRHMTFREFIGNSGSTRDSHGPMIDRPEQIASRLGRTLEDDCPVPIGPLPVRVGRALAGGCARPERSML